MKSSWSRWALCALAGATFVSAQVSAQPATRGLTPVPVNDAPPVALSVTLDQKSPQIGSTVSICFQASKPGYATLWNVSTAGQVVRVFPNQFSRTGTVQQIDGGRRYCAGTAGDPFRFRVDGPAGIEDLYLLWTTRIDLQPNGTDYASASALVGDLQRLGGANSSDWGSSKVTYDIVPPGGPAQFVLPPDNPPPAPDRQQANNNQPVADQPKVYILSIGANVGQLTKSNQDAYQFTTETKRLFSVPNQNIRVLENGTYAQWVDGMQWLARTAAPDDYVFIFFSGHGGQIPDRTSSDGIDEFLVPYDFTASNGTIRNAMRSQRFAYLINKLPTRNVVAVIDACHSGGVTRGLRTELLGARGKFMPLPEDVDPEKVHDSFAQEDAALGLEAPRTRAAGGRGRISANGLLLAAAKREQNAQEGSKGSLFTIALVQQMHQAHGGNLMDVFTRAVGQTEDMSGNKQTPVAVGDVDLGRAITFDK